MHDQIVGDGAGRGDHGGGGYRSPGRGRRGHAREHDAGRVLQSRPTQRHGGGWRRGRAFDRGIAEREALHQLASHATAQRIARLEAGGAATDDIEDRVGDRGCAFHHARKLAHAGCDHAHQAGWCAQRGLHCVCDGSTGRRGAHGGVDLGAHGIRRIEAGQGDRAGSGLGSRPKIRRHGWRRDRASRPREALRWVCEARQQRKIAIGCGGGTLEAEVAVVDRGLAAGETAKLGKARCGGGCKTGRRAKGDALLVIDLSAGEGAGGSGGIGGPGRVVRHEAGQCNAVTIALCRPCIGALALGQPEGTINAADAELGIDGAQGARLKVGRADITGERDIAAGDAGSERSKARREAGDGKARTLGPRLDIGGNRAGLLPHGEHPEQRQWQQSPPPLLRLTHCPPPHVSSDEPPGGPCRSAPGSAGPPRFRMTTSRTDLHHPLSIIWAGKADGSQV